MGGYVTTSRVTPGYLNGKKFDLELLTNGALTATFNGFPHPDKTGFEKWIRPTQVTTSYRSGGGDQDELLEFEGSSWAARTRSLARVERVKETSFDNGHEFESVREDFIPSQGKVNETATRTWKGPLVPYGPMSYPGTPSDPASLRAQGQVAISRTIPTNSPADLAQALIELKREGLPSLLGGSFLGSPRKASRDRPDPSNLAGEYLNTEFGIKPLLRDLRSTLEAVSDSSEILKTYQKGSGQKLHRQYTFPDTRYVSDVVTGGRLNRWPYYSITNSYNGLGSGTLTTTTETHIKTWFSGCYSYYLQEDSEVLNRLHEFAQEAQYILGLDLNVELLWEVAPWSWLIDWVTNIGINISNAQALSEDGLVLRYGYVMRETSITRTRSLVGMVPYRAGSSTACSSVHRFVRKQRIRATPYGFGLNPESFDSRKWAILGALGMTRGNNSLRLSD